MLIRCLTTLDHYTGGELKIQTSTARRRGVSGDVLLQTGDVVDKVSRGDAGKIDFATGSSVNGKGGDIVLRVGDSKMTDGGNIDISAGSSSGNTFHGGKLIMSSGESDFFTGEVDLKTPDSRNGNSGAINIATGNSGTLNGQSGHLFLSTGDG